VKLPIFFPDALYLDAVIAACAFFVFARSVWDNAKS